jgi:hypothetical protein
MQINRQLDTNLTEFRPREGMKLPQGMTDDTQMFFRMETLQDGIFVLFNDEPYT